MDATEEAAAVKKRNVTIAVVVVVSAVVLAGLAVLGLYLTKTGPFYVPPDTCLVPVAKRVGYNATSNPNPPCVFDPASTPVETPLPAAA